MRESIPVEITQPMAEVWNTVSRIPEIQTATYEKLIRSQSDWMDLCMEYGARQLQAFDGYCDPREAFATQSELASEYSAKLFDCAVNAFDLVTNANAEMIACIGPRVAEDASAATPDESGRAAGPAKSRRTAEAAATV